MHIYYANWVYFENIVNFEHITVFRCFQGVEKGCTGNKWVNTIIHFRPIFPFYTPWKHKTRGLWCFQGVQKGNIGLNWVNVAFVLLPWSIYFLWVADFLPSLFLRLPIWLSNVSCKFESPGILISMPNISENYKARLTGERLPVRDSILSENIGWDRSFIKNRALSQVISWEFCEILQQLFFRSSPGSCLGH